MLEAALYDIGITPNLRGYRGIVRCMALLAGPEPPEKWAIRDLCAEAALSCGGSRHSVYKNMQYAIRHFWNCGSREAYFKLAGCRPTTCPTVGEFLDTLLGYLETGPF